MEVMNGLPVTIRLLDPPLHEFVPHSEDKLAALAAELQDRHGGSCGSAARA